LQKEGYDVRKIPTLFLRGWADAPNHVTPVVADGCQWVIKGEGTATRKYDGTCMMFDGEQWWARREVKKGKTAPAGFIGLETDSVTAKTVGWEPVEQSSFAKYHAEATTTVLAGGEGIYRNAGTYELVGPKINGNPEGFSTHLLIYHDGADVLPDAPRDFDGLAAYLHAHPYEGIVWHHPDGRMAKIKKRDFANPPRPQ
jgi:hypothetical protein